MAHSHSACPICDTTIKDRTREDCDQCGWIIEIEGVLNTRIYDLLVDWGLRHYEKVKELESRGRHRQNLLNERLYRHKDEIDLLQKQMQSVLAHFPEIMTIPLARETIINLEKTTSENSIDDRENLQNSKTEESESESVPVDRQEIVLSHQEENNSTISELPKPHQAIISDYYHNPREFTTKYQVKVANITKDCINANRGSEEKNIILEETNRGNYWIFNFEDYNYLVPVEGKYINQHSYTTTSTIFEGHNYTPDYQKIQLIKPAVVSIDLNTNPQTWRLQQQGELAFS
jgi:hypothetical protein